ncbi:GNAT family N-acetyltransferase [Acinetobacter wanghuae]|uniref:GNAT family N-acetyltransferase n=1 Tax=Acinetobacter wanghuae TaxID=2662362 RepID=A0A5Q0P2P3_9GAMM|nr:GNAT family N-acetyltransferase [Acinetobacter wanghuae]MQW91517.1 GNAT family N-acetyltransferase [Acinetobacter wanghuae]QGA10872.1 GNAT family N-acetyltransferase [Acinetobacter wanghuae]
MDIKIIVKPLTEVTQSEWQALWLGYQAFYKTTITDDITAFTWSRLTDVHLNQIYGFAALIENQVVGIVHIIEHDSCWTIKPYAYLQDLFTLEHARGKGVATALIQHADQYTQQRGCDRLYWLTHQDNQAAQKLYNRVAKKTGFIQYRMP